MEQIEESAIPWMEDAFANPSTNLPEVIVEESNQIGTLIIFVVSAILTITLLFVIAIFIDCRQEKLAKLQKANRPKRILKIRIPRALREIGEDEETFADKIHLPDEPSTSSSTNQIV